MRKKIIIGLACFAVYLLLGWGTHAAQSRLLDATYTFYTGPISEVLGYQAFKDGRMSICVMGALKSDTIEEYQINVPADFSSLPAWSEYKPQTGTDGTKYLYPQSQDIAQGCDAKLKDMKNKSVSLDDQNGRIIAIDKGQPVTKIVVKTITDHHETERQKTLWDIVHVMNTVTFPGRFLIGIVMMLTGNMPSV